MNLKHQENHPDSGWSVRMSPFPHFRISSHIACPDKNNPQAKLATHSRIYSLDVFSRRDVSLLTTMSRTFKLSRPERDTTGFRCNSWSAYAWKQWTMFSATFAICGLEPWEKLVFGESCTLDLVPVLTDLFWHPVIVMSLFIFLFFTGLSRVMPSQSLLRRTAYYFWGDERVLNHWVDHAAVSVREL